MGSNEKPPVEAILKDRVSVEDLDEPTAIEVLRDPFCTVQIAERIAQSPKLTSTHRVCELLCMVRGMPASRVHDLISTLPWGPLLRLAQAPAAPPMVRKIAEQRLHVRIRKLTLGERVSLARRAHRTLFKTLTERGSVEVFGALLENPRMTEADVVSILASAASSAQAVRMISRNPRWSRRRRVRMAVARCPGAPLPIALSALADLGPGELMQIIQDPKVPAAVREGARRLRDRRTGGDATRR